MTKIACQIIGQVLVGTAFYIAVYYAGAPQWAALGGALIFGAIVMKE